MAQKSVKDELLKEIKAYWSNNAHLDFGALLDRLMALEGNIKHISYITNEEWLTWLKRVEQYSIFNANVLEKLRVNRLKNYHVNKNEKDKYGKEPIPLFIDGQFNKSNYFGGDDVIRAYFTEINNNKNGLAYPDVALEIEGELKNVGLIAQQYQNESYIIFFITVTGLNIQTVEQVFDMAVFGLKKEDINTIDFSWFNGKEMTEEQYCYILNVIKATGFDFFKNEEEVEKNSTNS